MYSICILYYQMLLISEYFGLYYSWLSRLCFEAFVVPHPIGRPPRSDSAIDRISTFNFSRNFGLLIANACMDVDNTLQALL